MKGSKLFAIILIIFFPIGIIYCIGKNLFNGTFASFLGALFIFGAGMLVCLYIKEPEVINVALDWVKSNIPFIQNIL